MNVADTGPLESLVMMLRSVGYQCYLPDSRLKDRLRKAGCDTVLNISDLVKQMGYSRPFPQNPLPEIGEKAFPAADLYVDVKAHRNYPKVVAEWPSLAGKVLWYRINGGKPEHVVRQCPACVEQQQKATTWRIRCPECVDCGDEIDPPCPVLTPNLWYRGKDNAYAVWPPFYRYREYPERIGTSKYEAPVCLIHNLKGWGYGRLIDSMRDLGVRCYGEGSPDGLVQHSRVKTILRHAKAMIHLKSSDAPGYALYEALAAACPVVVTRRLIWRNKMEDLFIPGVTCHVFDRETHDPLSDDDVTACTEEVRLALDAISDPEHNRKIGEAGRRRLKEVMWKEESDSDSLAEFMRKYFG